MTFALVVAAVVALAVLLAWTARRTQREGVEVVTTSWLASPARCALRWFLRDGVEVVTTSWLADLLARMAVQQWDTADKTAELKKAAAIPEGIDTDKLHLASAALFWLAFQGAATSPTVSVLGQELLDDLQSRLPAALINQFGVVHDWSLPRDSLLPNFQRFTEIAVTAWNENKDQPPAPSWHVMTRIYADLTGTAPADVTNLQFIYLFSKFHSIHTVSIVETLGKFAAGRFRFVVQ